jgi:2-keto-4-pentenoate hydratase/2-oxohepta-3-ene-1,7-dioic acid hydratase in catechol pathway
MTQYVPRIVRTGILACLIAHLAADGATASGLDACLDEQGFPRVARLLDPQGRIVFARVTQQRDGHITRASTIARSGTRLAEVFERANDSSAADYPVSDDRVCAVVELSEAELDAETRVIVSTGLNYAAHAEEAGGGDVFLFPKPAAPTRPYATVHAPDDVTLLDYEVELAYVLLEEVDPFDPPSREALLAKSAFFLSNDVSDREAIIRNAALSGPGTGFVEGKGQRGFLPAGPWMVRGTELFAAVRACGAEGLGLRLSIDDEAEPRQSANTTQMILQPDELIGRIGSWIAEYGLRTPMPFARNGEVEPEEERFYPFAVGENPPMLPAGSIVQTGTPEGVALNAPSPLGVTLRGLLRLRGPFSQFLVEEKARVAEGGTRYLAPGQVVHARIDGLGTQEFEIGGAGGRAGSHPCTAGDVE